MQRKSLIATLLAAAFAVPFAVNAGGTGKHAASATNGTNDGGAEAMFKSMDKDGDGTISKAEAAGTPHAAHFAQLDKDRDGKLSRAEHANAPEHVAARSDAKPGSTTAGASADATGSKKTY